MRGNAIIRKDIIAQHLQYSLEPFLLLKLLRLHHWNFSIKEKKELLFYFTEMRRTDWFRRGQASSNSRSQGTQAHVRFLPGGLPCSPCLAQGQNCLAAFGAPKLAFLWRSVELNSAGGQVESSSQGRACRRRGKASWETSRGRHPPHKREQSSRHGLGARASCTHTQTNLTHCLCLQGSSSSAQTLQHSLQARGALYIHAPFFQLQLPFKARRNHLAPGTL